ncbi:SH3 domain-containing protein [Crucibulum laeve]|uniref:SH3 domain-containing protein n=1 Tax=Crucibulum laeve TaxID=68775 RepID=A0A5C3M485_9AGAR|nr:SH3 domain-containing protein [Crucibulum laeve]
MAPQDPQAAALLAHVLLQVEQNVQFLASNNYISQADASAILTKLPNASASNNGAIANLTSRMGNLRAAAAPSAPPPAPRAVPTAPQGVQARAIWAYNENGADPDDLSFSAGDIIEIVEETNADWWMGRVNGKQALFPANYVEKIAPVTPSPAAPTNRPVYKPFGAAYHGVTAPPPPGQGVNNVGLQEVDQTEKKSKYGGLKNTMAHSAAGGVGFGAGAAIGGGLVRAIF